MRKIITILPITAALFAGQALAEQSTVKSLQEYCVALTEEQNTLLTLAEGQSLVQAIAQLVTTQPIKASTIAVATTRSHTSLADEIVAAAVQAAPEQEQEIRAAIQASKANTFAAVGPCTQNPDIPFTGFNDTETSAGEIARVGTANLPSSSIPSSGAGNSGATGAATGIQIASPN